MRLFALDLMRFGAALAVVLYHYTARPAGPFELISEITRYGYLGVPLFFMISGFVISVSAHNRSAFEFAVSRAIRLYPAFWLGTILTAIALLAFKGHDTSLSTILANFTMLNDYMGVENIDDVYWTLQAELKFYGCMFLLVAFRVFQYMKVWLSAWMGITILHLLTGEPGFMGWFISPTWSSYFIAGVACYHIHRFGASLFGMGMLSLSLAVSLARNLRVTDGFISEVGMVEQAISSTIVLSFFILLVALALGRLTFKGGAWAGVLGSLTYPLYLIHNGAGKAVIDRFKEIVPEGLMVAIVLLCMLLTSLIIAKYFEPRAAARMKRTLVEFRKGLIGLGSSPDFS